MGCNHKTYTNTIVKTDTLVTVKFDTLRTIKNDTVYITITRVEHTDKITYVEKDCKSNSEIRYEYKWKKDSAKIVTRIIRDTIKIEAKKDIKLAKIENRSHWLFWLLLGFMLGILVLNQFKK